MRAWVLPGSSMRSIVRDLHKPKHPANLQETGMVVGDEKCKDLPVDLIFTFYSTEEDKPGRPISRTTLRMVFVIHNFTADTFRFDPSWYDATTAGLAYLVGT